jgi:hypothetical protein
MGAMPWCLVGAEAGFMLIRPGGVGTAVDEYPVHVS